jgi:uncharacterized protein (DUF1778 family)
MTVMARMARKTEKPTKERHLSVRISESDLAALERAAGAARLSVATYVRQQALAAAERDDPEARQRRVAGLIRRMATLPRFDRGAP